ncbi:hypothetical protein Clacol_002476 [Clathrus columnatus]|uniref:Protein-lysine N-methyltransferase EFM4 n=1 Tax=Clathrus columnatus TaxID=1419009 RepID=A0AAV5A0U8_9AGAM|nr:hypothetical protein Clacol_002476 [Clathrus columnatus]
MSFQPSKLGTREYWDNIYDEEIENFEDIGDEGEIWFGEESMLKMVQWVIEHAPPQRNILEVGTGNGVLLCELATNGYDPSHLLGIDYSLGSIALSKRVAEKRGIKDISFSLCDFLSENPLGLGHMDGNGVGQWDLLLDKGTFDAIALSKPDASGKVPADSYPHRVARLLGPGGLFLLTSCNYTEEELRERFVSEETGLTYQYETFYCKPLGLTNLNM